MNFNSFFQQLMMSSSGVDAFWLVFGFGNWSLPLGMSNVRAVPVWLKNWVPPKIVRV